MGLRVLGFFTILFGIFVVWASFHADEIGIGRYEGVGGEQMLLTGLGFFLSFIGIVMTFAQRGQRRRR